MAELASHSSGRSGWPDSHGGLFGARARAPFNRPMAFPSCVSFTGRELAMACDAPGALALTLFDSDSAAPSWERTVRCAGDCPPLTRRATKTTHDSVSREPCCGAFTSQYDAAAAQTYKANETEVSYPTAGQSSRRATNRTGTQQTALRAWSRGPGVHACLKRKRSDTRPRRTPAVRLLRTAPHTLNIT